ESATIMNRELPPALWRRKSALPLVIMGLPVWMTTQLLDRRSYASHLRWLYRLGRFFGLVDDAADLEEDRAAGRPNCFLRATGREVADPVARQGLLLLKTWDAGAPPSRHVSTMRETFLAITWSWLDSRTAEASALRNLDHPLRSA